MCLPTIVAFLMPTCNRFTRDDVLHQWEQVTEAYNASLANILGPIVGHSSDGDTRKRKLNTGHDIS